ncbi:MAG TPA: alpha/beta fold hydrolase [Ktedonobacteraceae bacterium]|nr:alpha/beta fold hydrolase [Ktedonobacteraceae bacterium]
MTTRLPYGSWIICSNPGTHALIRLFCFPYAGGTASMFYDWVANLPAGVEVCIIQLPGRENRFMEPPFDRLIPLVEALADNIQPYLDLPCVFFGHSMGGLICFELARYLWRNYKIKVAHLFVSGQSAPQLPDPYPAVHQLTDAELLEELRNFKGTPEMVLQNTELMELLLPTLRADFAISETYHYTFGEPLETSISVFGGLQDEKLTQENLSAWCSQTRGSFKLQMFPGDHFFLHDARESLLQTISSELLNLLNSKGPSQ